MPWLGRPVMVLPRRVAGFGNFSGPAVDFPEFREACFPVARRRGGRESGAARGYNGRDAPTTTRVGP
jgi:hypothetical protein